MYPCKGGETSSSNLARSSTPLDWALEVLDWVNAVDLGTSADNLLGGAIVVLAEVLHEENGKLGGLGSVGTDVLPVQGRLQQI